MAADDVGMSATPNDWPSQERDRRADLLEASADERERLADERERLADERERLADDRERLADDQEWALDRQAHSRSVRGFDDAADQAEARAAIERAEAAVERAEADLVRAHERAGRVAARAAQRTATTERGIASDQVQAISDVDERAWLADRRDFVAAGRESVADERDQLADQRDELADDRERLADVRERASLARERLMHAGRVGGGTASDQRLHDHESPAAAPTRRRSAKDRRRTGADWGPSAYGPRLMTSFADLARELFAAERPDEFLEQILKFTVAAVPGCDYASVMLWRDLHVVESAASHVIAAELDDVQFGSGSGPAVAALHSADPVYVPSLETISEWPVLAAAAREAGVASVLSLGLFVSRPIGWLSQGTFTLYGTAQDSFDVMGQEFVSVIAAYLSVAVAMTQRRNDLDRREAALHRALSTRDVIGQAKGILMERRRLTAGEAFDVLRRASQTLNLKLADVAVRLAETGELPASS